MEKTAMQIAIDSMLSDSFKVENLTRFDVAKKLIELKELEKQQMIDFGDDAQRTDFYVKFQDMKEAFNDKFGGKIKP